MAVIFIGEVILLGANLLHTVEIKFEFPFIVESFHCILNSMCVEALFFNPIDPAFPTTQ